MSAGSKDNIQKQVRYAVVVAAALLISLSLYQGGSRSPFASSETYIAEPSPSGLLIVPASCPSDPHYEGDCSITPPAPDLELQCFGGTTFGVSLSAPGYSPAPGLVGFFYDGTSFQTYVSQAIDNTINFNPADTVLGTNRAGGSDTFSVSWFGYVRADVTGTYTFYTTSDDGVLLWVNDQEVIDNWTNHGATENSGTISLVAGRWYPIRLDYYDNTGGSVITLSYSASGISKQIIPSSNLSRSGGLIYWVDWDDGSSHERVPVSGHVAHNNPQSASHEYVDPEGSEIVRVRSEIQGQGDVSSWVEEPLSCGDEMCPSGYICSGDDLRYHNSICEDNFVQACAYGCTGSFPNASCVLPPTAQFAPFTAFLPGSLGGGQFEASGELEARPTLVRQGETTQLYWNTVNTESCSTIGTNGFSSSATSSGQNGQVSGAINEQTNFTLDCTGFGGEAISDRVIVNIIPVVQEK